MEERTIRMKFGKAFTYIFDDPNWTSKLLAPVFITLIPVIGILVAVGYYLDLTRNVSRGEPYPLPNFDFGPQLARGFKWFVIQLIYGIPMVVLSVFLVPFIVDIVNKSDKGITATFSIFMVVALGLLILGIGLLISLIIPVAQANFANKDTIRSGLAFREIFRMLGNKFRVMSQHMVSTPIAELHRDQVQEDRRGEPDFSMEIRIILQEELPWGGSAKR